MKLILVYTGIYFWSVNIILSGGTSLNTCVFPITQYTLAMVQALTVEFDIHEIIESEIIGFLIKFMCGG